MGVVLYKIGTKHTINGWECDKQVFDPEYLNLDARLAQGWHLSPDCGRVKEEPKVIEVKGMVEPVKVNTVKLVETVEAVPEQPKKPETVEVKDDGVQKKKQVPKKKAAKPKKRKIVLEFPLTQEIIEKANQMQLQAYSKEYKIKNYSRLPKKRMKEKLLEKIGEQDDNQN